MEMASGWVGGGAIVLLSTSQPVWYPNLLTLGQILGSQAPEGLILTSLTLNDLGQVPCTIWGWFPHLEHEETGLNSLLALGYIILYANWGCFFRSWAWEASGLVQQPRSGSQAAWVTSVLLTREEVEGVKG